MAADSMGAKVGAAIVFAVAAVVLSLGIAIGKGCSKRAEPEMAKVECPSCEMFQTIPPTPSVEPVEEEAPEPPKEWKGACHDGSRLLWSGSATDFNSEPSCATSECTRFKDAVTKKYVQIEGRFSCVWDVP